MAELQARWHGSIAEIPEDQWQAVTAAAGLPFYSWSWLERLEASGSIVPSQGWQPVHLGLWRGESLLAVAPLYVKGHSYGEFVFDQAFAQLAGQLGLRYYPKLLGMSPVSPVLGYRFHIAPGEDEPALTALLLGLIEAGREQEESARGDGSEHADPDQAAPQPCSEVIRVVTAGKKFVDDGKGGEEEPGAERRHHRPSQHLPSARLGPADRPVDDDPDLPAAVLPGANETAADPPTSQRPDEFGRKEEPSEEREEVREGEFGRLVMLLLDRVAGRRRLIVDTDQFLDRVTINRATEGYLHGTGMRLHAAVLDPCIDIPFVDRNLRDREKVPLDLVVQPSAKTIGVGDLAVRDEFHGDGSFTFSSERHLVGHRHLLFRKSSPE
jgi:hypothetical protein